MGEEPQTPSLSEQINSNGFRRWHEYELTRSFGYLGLGVITLVAGLALIEGAGDLRILSERLFRLVLGLVSLGITAWSWLRFLVILVTAEGASRQALCGQCNRYGRIQVTDERSSEDLSEKILTCQCKKCGHVWRMHYALQFRNART